MHDQPIGKYAGLSKRKLTIKGEGMCVLPAEEY